MKLNLPMPVVVGSVVAVLFLVAFFMIKGVTAEPHTPRPDRSMFMKYTKTPTP